MSQVPTPVPPPTLRCLTEEEIDRKIKAGVQEAVNKSNEQLYKQASWDRLQALGVFVLVTLLLSALTYFLGSGIIAARAQSIAQAEAQKVATGIAEQVAKATAEATARGIAEAVARQQADTTARNTAEATAKEVTARVTDQYAAEAVKRYHETSEAGKNEAEIRRLLESAKWSADAARESASIAARASVEAADKSPLDALRRESWQAAPVAIFAYQAKSTTNPNSSYFDISTTEGKPVTIPLNEPIKLETKRSGTVVVTVSGLVSSWVEHQARDTHIVLLDGDGKEVGQSLWDFTSEALSTVKRQTGYGFLPFSVTHAFRVNAMPDGKPLELRVAVHAPGNAQVRLTTHAVRIAGVYLPDPIPQPLNPK
ncbi:hypothetical protein J4558_09430 [Leptolyngbya sp. 15MV]|nr:hypothetical protein J4558_09430 [Leptolyngbya sp. 15MV]